MHWLLPVITALEKVASPPELPCRCSPLHARASSIAYMYVTVHKAMHARRSVARTLVAAALTAGCFAKNDVIFFEEMSGGSPSLKAFLVPLAFLMICVAPGLRPAPGL